MCGIAGIAAFDHAPDLAVVKAMTDALWHRGPDGEGFFNRDRVAFGHRRLKIIDLSEAAKQPIADAAGNAVVTYNGEIYNYRELRETLGARGHRFLSRCDSETIPVAYAQWGDSFLEHLHGMFAFALYDLRKRRLLLARDRIGIKPLYIVRRPHFIAFASEIKAFIAAGLLTPRPNPLAIAAYVQRGYHHGGQSFYEGVEELQPGHYATVSPDGDFQVRAYWKLPEASADVGEDPRTALRGSLEQAARTHLQSDVPVGAQLSGGIDSSAVVGLLSQQQSERLHTFSVYFDEGAYYDERPFIYEVERRYDTQHHYTVPTWRDAQESLPAILRSLDEPVNAGPAVIPTYLLYKDIRARGIVVANGGQGGDEMFAGYPRHLLPYALAEIASGPSGRRNAILALRKLGPKGLLRFSAEHAVAPGTFMLHSDLRRQVPAWRRTMRFNDLLRSDLTGYLYCLLQIEDRLSMASSVESRVPLLDDSVIELAASMHSRWKVRDGVPKRVLRDAVADLLPKKVLERKDKRGLPTPFGIWIRGPMKDYARAVLTDPMLKQERFFSTSLVERMFQIHCRGTADLGGLLWRPFAIALWLQNLRSLAASGSNEARAHAAARQDLLSLDLASARRDAIG
jgi:asparagine synthase (glutamine-hydrolysing)